MPTLAKKLHSDLPTIVLVGRVNVGKSTLFNALIEKQKAIVSTIPGTTRTSNEGFMIWRGKQCRIIDTGGLSFTDNVPLEADIIKQSEQAIRQADVIVFVTDARTGILPQEKELARRLQKTKKTIILVANKADSQRQEQLIASGEWEHLGFGSPLPISATTGRGTGDFLDAIFATLNATTHKPGDLSEQPETIQISIIGKPNVGKSSLFNSLIGEDRVIVSDIPHTTREPYDTPVTYEHKEGAEKILYHINFIDTAGIRRKAKVSGFLERVGISKSIHSIEQSDIILFVIDGTEPISTQDKQLAGLLESKAKSVIMILNKWDMAEKKDDAYRREVKETLRAHFPAIDFAPILFISAKTGLRIHQIFPEIIHAWQARHIELPPSALSHFLAYATKKHTPSRGKGTRQPKLLGLRQIGTHPPVFELFIKHKTSVHLSYVRFLENLLREQFDFFACPILIKLTKMKK